MRADWEIAIPSYRRAETLARKTLAYLKTTDVPLARATVFVASDQERQDYEAVLGGEVRIVVGALGMRGARNFIQQHYADGARVFCLDDDVSGLFERIDPKTLQPLTRLRNFVDTGFSLAERSRVRLWGVYPVCNPFFMKPKTTLDLRYIVGCCWGVTNDRSAQLAVTLDDKEDFERTLKFYLADGGVLRFGHVAPRTAYYREPGGMQVERTIRRVQESAAALASRYPQLCSLDRSKERWELRLKDRRLRAPAVS
jgi:hypothetical protein